MSARKALAAVLAVFVLASVSGGAVPGGTLHPSRVPKFVTPLVIPPEMPSDGVVNGAAYYEIAVRQFMQQVLPAGFPKTTVWSYGSVSHPETFNYPAFTIEATVNTATRVKWVNDLKDPNTGDFFQSIVPVDQTVHFANPSQQACADDPPGTDCRTLNQAPYDGPVPMVVHVHGAHVDPESDGYPEAWWLPAASNIPAGYATRGPKFAQAAGAPLEDGAAVFQYRNDQPATTLWYHDHTLGMTHTNVYAGPAGFLLLRGGANDLPSGGQGGLPGPAPKAGDPAGTRYYEIPLAIQDRSFNNDGSLFYPSSREFFDGFEGPYIGDPDGRASDISPIWNPEFFGNMLLVNGNTWPYLEVEPRKYRFRILNGCDSRFLILKFNVPLKFHQIGAEQGFLPAPVTLKKLLVAPAERADVIVDFSSFSPGEEILLRNIGPDEPFQGFPIPLAAKADRRTTGKVMLFRVVPLTAPDNSVIPATLPAPAPVDASAAVSRRISINEEESEQVCVDTEANYLPDFLPPACGGIGAPEGPDHAFLGTVDEMGNGMPMMFDDAITENPAVGATEIWEIHNFTEDAHPIHLHLVGFQVIDRTPMGDVIGGPTSRAPEPWEAGFKDTVVAYPHEVTRIKATFDVAGLYVWHCHIIEHEDNEMMRRYCVGDLSACN